MQNKKKKTDKETDQEKKTNEEERAKRHTEKESCSSPQPVAEDLPPAEPAELLMEPCPTELPGRTYNPDIIVIRYRVT